MKKPAKHTPGPWIADTAKTRIGIFEEDSGILIATVPFVDKEGKANAALLAAAPDLLTALQDLHQAIQTCAVNDYDRASCAEVDAAEAQALATIAKAKAAPCYTLASTTKPGEVTP